jgi:hypothetical protein
MFQHKISRRSMMQMGLGAAATAGLATSTGSVLARASVPSPVSLDIDRDSTTPHDSIDGAYAFLTQMMDAYAQGNTVRLCQSYSDQIAGGTFHSTAFTYDNALLVCAWLATVCSRPKTRIRQQTGAFDKHTWQECRTPAARS